MNPVQASIPPQILPFAPERAADFDRINREWIERMFVVEAVDDRVLRDPQTHLIDPGGDILFVAFGDLGIVGAGALRKEGPGVFELTKMGVLPTAQGRKAGEALLHALLERARDLGAETLYLLTNTRCAPAIHLYEKCGFVHCPGIKERFGASYDRCDVAMRWVSDRLD